MPVLAGNSHEGRVTAGDSLIEAATTHDTGRVKARLTQFAGAHRALVKAQTALDAAERALGARRAIVAERDVDQDDSVDRVASALVGDGLPRVNPFKGLSTHTPTKLKTLGYAAEAKALTALVSKARRRKGLSPKTLATLTGAEKAARAIATALDAVGPAMKAIDGARSRRDALVQPWETAFAALKRGARAAEDDGSKGLFAALFESTAAAKRPAKKPKKPAAPPPVV
jgi:hypothetical protein